MTNTNEIKIAVSISGVKPYVGLITGTDSQYGFALQFLPLTRKSAKYHTAEITQDGQYRLTPGATVAARRIDTGYIRVSGGVVTEIKKTDVVL